MSIQSHPVQHIALNRLVASPRDVRRKDRKAEIAALAASIAAQGLLQNLCVVAGMGGAQRSPAFLPWLLARTRP